MDSSVNLRQYVIYVSGPYSGDIKANIASARTQALNVWNAGFTGLCPHLNTSGFEMDCDANYLDYIEGDKRLLDGCDAMFLIECWSESQGAAEEKKYAEEVGKPVFYHLDNIVEYFTVNQPSTSPEAQKQMMKRLAGIINDLTELIDG